MHKFVANWIRNLNLEEINALKGDRRCAILGGGESKDDIQAKLREKNLPVDIWLTDSADIVDSMSYR